MRNKLISTLAGTAFSFAASELAFAQVPPPAPAPVYNWTGWYVGGNVGASFGTFKTDFNAPVTGTIINPHTTPSPTGTFTNDFAGSDTLYPGGFVGGGQIGYNWQFSPTLVVGDLPIPPHIADATTHRAKPLYFCLII